MIRAHNYAASTPIVCRRITSNVVNHARFRVSAIVGRFGHRKYCVSGLVLLGIETI